MELVAGGQAVPLPAGNEDGNIRRRPAGEGHDLADGRGRAGGAVVDDERDASRERRADGRRELDVRENLVEAADDDGLLALAGVAAEISGGPGDDGGALRIRGAKR